MTPRKSKARQQAHRRTASLVPASDYESDILPSTAAPHNHALPPPTRTNTELNLSVLRRYHPSILTILSIAASAVIYTFTPATQSWEKSGLEGTLFVCETQAPSSGALDAGYAVVVLNRRGLENLILDLARAEDVEVTAELLIVRFAEGGDGGEGQGAAKEEEEAAAAAARQKVMGVWIHEDKDGAREVNAGLIQQCWEKVRSVRKGQCVDESEAGVRNGAKTVGNGAARGERKGGGRRISLSDLFGQGSAQ